MTLRVNIVQPVEDHLKHNLQEIRRDDSTESLLVYPQKFSQGLKNNA